MSFSEGELLLGQLRVERDRGRAAALALADATQLDGSRARVIGLDIEEPSRVDLHAVLERARRLTLGAPHFAPVVGVGIESSASAERRLIVAYAISGEATLDQQLRDGRPLSGRRVADVARAIAEALAPLHDQGIAHGAIAPALVVVGESTTLLGQSLLALTDSLGGPRLACSIVPPAFLAPELRGAVARRPEPWSDVYAFGVLCGALLAGRLPEDEADAVGPRALGAEVDDDVERVLAACVSASVAARPRDLGVVARDLSEAVRESEARNASQAAAAPSATAVQVSASEVSDVPAATPTAARPPGADAAPPDAAAPRSLPNVAVTRVAPTDRGARSPSPHRPRPRPPDEPRSWLAVAMLVGGVLLMAGGVVLGLSMAALRSSASAPTIGAAGAGPSTGIGAAGALDDLELDAGPPSADGGVVAEGGTSVDAGSNEELRAGPALVDGTGAAAALAVVSSGDALAALPLDSRLPSLGPATANVTLVLFGDLECPHTRRMIRLLAALRARAPGELRLVWRHRPLEIHPGARAAARVAASLADAHGATSFWRLLDQLAHSSEPADATRLMAWATEAGGTAGEVSAWLKSESGAARVDDDLALSARFSVRATPTSFVNGERVDGTPTGAELDTLFDVERSAARRLLSAGVATGDLYRTRVDENLIGLRPHKL